MARPGKDHPPRTFRMFFFRGLGVLKPDKQVENLIEWLGYMQSALKEPALAGITH